MSNLTSMQVLSSYWHRIDFAFGASPSTGGDDRTRYAAARITALTLMGRVKRSEITRDSVKRVRTTLDLDDGVLLAVKERARREKRTAGDVLSDLARAWSTLGRGGTTLPSSRRKERPGRSYRATDGSSAGCRRREAPYGRGRAPETTTGCLSRQNTLQ